MNSNEIINELEKVENKYKDKVFATGELNIHEMVKYCRYKIEELYNENMKLQRRIDKTVQTIDEILSYNKFNDTTYAFGNAPETLKFYLSDCETLEKFRKENKI